MAAPIDARRLRPSETVRLLNSTTEEPVISERQLYRHRQRAGFRIAAEGDTSRVDLYRYIAWLTSERHKLKAAPSPDALTGYDAMKERSRQRNAALSLSGRNIGELPEVVNPERRERAARDFRYFCEAYFSRTFNKPWCNDHLKVIAKIERAVLHGGLFAMAMPRASGKSSLCETACDWAILYGHREFVALVGSDEEHAAGMLDSIKSALENNELLAQDFPEVCHPIAALEGITQRAAGQLYRGRPTNILWTGKEIILPTIEGSPASGAIIKVAGITGRIRGMKYTRPDGGTVRPSLVLVDDPQTDESARSPSQCASRESVLAGAILGLAGPGEKIAGLMTLTVVRPDDLADRILNRDKHPDWQGERTKMLYSLPTNEKLWDEYARIRAEGLKTDAEKDAATEFYRKHRAEMDEGAVVAWAERYTKDEISAIQHAMNIRLRDLAAFQAEYQNDPLPVEGTAGGALMSPDEIAAKTNGMPRAQAAIACTHLTAFIDIQETALYWLVAGWEESFTGYVLDYGTEPDQHLPYFALRDVKRTLAQASSTAGLEAQIYAGLERLTAQLLGREWQRDDGAMVRIDKCLIDANWGRSTDTVHQFCRQSPYAGVLMPAHGRYVGASSVPFSEYKKQSGERAGLNWRIPPLNNKRAIRHVLFDTNYWKSFIHGRLAVPMGDPGCLSLFGRRPADHRMLADHLTAEYRIKTEGRGRVVDEWKLKPSGQDNHFFDCLVGSAVAASMQGAMLFGTDGGKQKRERKKVRLSDWHANRERSRGW